MEQVRYSKYQSYPPTSSAYAVHPRNVCNLCNPGGPQLLNPTALERLLLSLLSSTLLRAFLEGHGAVKALCELVSYSCLIGPLSPLFSLSHPHSQKISRATCCLSWRAEATCTISPPSSSGMVPLHFHLYLHF